MKFSISRLVMCLLMGCAVVPPYADYQQQYFPEGVNDVYLGMTYQFMSKTREGTNLVPIALGSDSTILTYEEVHPDKDFDRIIYSFEKDDEWIKELFSLPLNKSILKLPLPQVEFLKFPKETKTIILDINAIF